MFIDRTDDPNSEVHLLSVSEADAGELEEPSRAIAIELVVTGRGRFVAYGLDLGEGDGVVTSDEPLPSVVTKKAAEITKLWVAGRFTVPFSTVSSASEL